MKKIDFKAIKKYIPLFLFIIAILCCNLAIADVGNQNRYVPSGGDGGGLEGIGDGGGELIGFLIGLLFDESPGLAILLVIAVVIFTLIKKKKKNGASNDTGNAAIENMKVNQQVMRDRNITDDSQNIAAKIQEIDPEFSAEKFITWAKEVFLKIQEAWTAKDWKVIRTLESENLFNQHKQQLDEYIRKGQTNVVERIGIKHCSILSFHVDGDKEVITVALNAVLRDYIIDDATKKVIESDPKRDWYMKYIMVFNRKAGMKTGSGDGVNITNCPNCGAPTEITSSGQCPYCGSVITTDKHSWVLTDIQSTN